MLTDLEERKRSKKSNKLDGSFLCLQLARDSTPPEKGEDLNLHFWHHFPHPPDRAQCPHGRMLHSSAVRHRRGITAQIMSQCSASDVSFYLQQWLEFGSALWKY